MEIPHTDTIEKELNIITFEIIWYLVKVIPKCKTDPVNDSLLTRVIVSFPCQYAINPYVFCGRQASNGQHANTNDSYKEHTHQPSIL